MQIKETETVRTYYVADGEVTYKVVNKTWSPEPHWRVIHHPDKVDGDWQVYSSQGIHRYARLCDPDKPTHKRVVNAVRALTQPMERENVA
jgi:hypothetical protein